jgi:hypothetical protein
LTLSVLCKQLPPADRWDSTTHTAKCDPADTATRYETVITEPATGVYTSKWKGNYNNEQAVNLYAMYSSNNFTATACTSPSTGAQPNCGYTPYLLNPNGWQYLNGTPNQPDTNYTVNQHFKAGLFTVAGYFYGQSADRINNCNNCLPTGAVDGRNLANPSVTVGDQKLINPDIAYILPVNALTDELGNVTGAALDAKGNPLVKQDAADAAGFARDADGKPVSAGKPIALTEIIEKYLAHLGGTVTDSNLKTGRISLVHNDGSAGATLPSTLTTMGFKNMQPLCGTIGQTEDVGNACP